MWVFAGILAVVVVACAALFAGLLRVAVKWGTEALELQRDGVEVSGTIVEKRSYSRRGATTTYIRYEYVDRNGKRHRSRRNLVTPLAWDTHVEGGPIAVIYSQRRPSVSLPKHLVLLRPDSSTPGA
jgi:hypothetical protein